MFTITHTLLLAALLFTIGVYGVICRRNLLVVLMSIEIMLASVSLTLIAFGREFEGPSGHDGQVLVIFNMAVAAAEAAVGLALLIVFYRRFQTLDSDHADTMQG